MVCKNFDVVWVWVSRAVCVLRSLFGVMLRCGSVGGRADEHCFQLAQLPSRCKATWNSTSEYRTISGRATVEPDDCDKLTVCNKKIQSFFTSPTGAVAKYCDEHVCVCVCLVACLYGRISPEPSARSLPNFFEHVAYAMAWSCSGKVMKSQGKGAIWGIFFFID